MKITAKNLGYSIKDKSIVRDISLEFLSDEISLILGPNGAGKSTLLKLLSGQLKPTTGEIFYDGIRLSEMALIDLAQIRAILSQNTEVAFPLTVEQIVTMGRYPHIRTATAKENYEICMAAMAFFNIETFAKRNYLTLSGGEQQRVHFARVAAQIWPSSVKTPKVLFLDEPLTHLDIYYQNMFLTKIRELMDFQELVLVGIVHDLNLASNFGDKLCFLKNGTIQHFGTAEESFTTETIYQSFGLKGNIFNDPNGKKLITF